MKNKKPGRFSKNKPFAARDNAAKGRSFRASKSAPGKSPGRGRDESPVRKPSGQRARFDKKRSYGAAAEPVTVYSQDNRPSRKPFGPRKRFDKKRSYESASDGRPERSAGKRRDDFTALKPFRAFENKGKPNRQGFKPGKPASRPAPAEPQRPSLRPERKGVMLWGIHAVREAWLNPKRQCFNLWLTEAGKQAMTGALAAAALEEAHRPTPVIIEKHEMDRLLPPGCVHQGVALECAPLPDQPLHTVLKVTNQPDLLIVLDQVTDPHNVGAILRSAAAFGASAVIMTERHAPQTTGVLAKAASGAAEHVPLIYVTNLARALTELQEAGYWCVGLAEEATRDLSELDLSARTALVLGAEGEGLRRLTRESCDELARLPTAGPIGSLNVSNAAAIALYEARKQKLKFT